jgi:hypothetical protein
VSLFTSRLNRTLTVSGYTQTSVDGGGQPVFTEAEKGTVRGRIDPKVKPDEMDGPDVNPVISQASPSPNATRSPRAARSSRLSALPP